MSRPTPRLNQTSAEIKECVECYGKIWYEGILDEVNLHHSDLSYLDPSRASKLDRMVSKFFNSLIKKRAEDALAANHAEKKLRGERTSAQVPRASTGSSLPLQLSLYRPWRQLLWGLRGSASAQKARRLDEASSRSLPAPIILTSEGEVPGSAKKYDFQYPFKFNFSAYTGSVAEAQRGVLPGEACRQHASFDRPVV